MTSVGEITDEAGGPCITCKFHNSKFDLKTGKAVKWTTGVMGVENAFIGNIMGKVSIKIKNIAVPRWTTKPGEEGGYLHSMLLGQWMSDGGSICQGLFANLYSTVLGQSLSNQVQAWQCITANEERKIGCLGGRRRISCYSRRRISFFRGYRWTQGACD